MDTAATIAIGKKVAKVANKVIKYVREDNAASYGLDEEVRAVLFGDNVAVIEEGAVVGERPEAMQNLDDWGVAVVGEHITVGKDAVVAPKAMVDTDVSAVR